ncbi:methyl-accepting chemotaxis protein [Brevundimonas sp.]|uniref:methyl-accepting chemotaxis protein n=1 Tax=Brevundimonas sp. TaxID=1871086 RepID=UPI002610AC60|nr:methyl-accepting chemotaxis protein [Brevundimonas sp.]
MSIRVSGVLNLFAALLIGGFVLTTGAAVFSLMTLRVGGPISQEQSQAQVLLADVLPPPLYVVESLLTAHRGPDELDKAREIEAELTRLHGEYDARLQYWAAQPMTPKIRSELSLSDAEAQKFWTVVDQSFLPALRTGDVATMDAAIVTLSGHYQAHRTVIYSLAADATAHAESRVEAAHQMSNWIYVLLAVTSLMMLIVVIGGILILRRRVVRPVLSMTGYMGRLAGGDYEKEAPHRNRTDEIGDMARSVGVFREAVLERRAARLAQEARDTELQQERDGQYARTESEARRREQVVAALAEGLSALADGDLSHGIADPFPEEFEELRINFNRSIRALEDTLSHVVAGARAVDGGAREIAAAADDLSQRTEQQAASLEQTAAALDEVTATVRQTADNAAEAQGAMSHSRQVVGESSAVAGEAIEAMGRIDASSREISNIIGVIDEIAFQTNLLALNAGVEAARAGDSGRGFAVVAQEVRALAQRSAEAAREIKGLIAQSSGSVQSGVSLVTRVGRSLNGVVEEFARIEDLVSDIAGAAREQATGLAEVNTAVNQMDNATQQNAAMVEETTAASHNLGQEAAELTRLVAGFKLARESELRLAA